MSGDQLPLFQRKTYKGVIPSLPVGGEAPTGEMTVLHVLPAYYSYLQGGEFSKYTPDDFTGDVKKFGVFLKGRVIQDIARRDIQAWIAQLKSPVPKGEGLSAKTVSRKLTALRNFFSWLVATDRCHGRIRSAAGYVLPIYEQCATTKDELIFELIKYDGSRRRSGSGASHNA